MTKRFLQITFEDGSQKLTPFGPNDSVRLVIDPPKPVKLVEFVDKPDKPIVSMIHEGLDPQE